METGLADKRLEPARRAEAGLTPDRRPQPAAHAPHRPPYAYQKESALREQLETYKVQWAERLERFERDEPIPFPGWNDWEKAACRTVSSAGGSSG